MEIPANLFYVGEYNFSSKVLASDKPVVVFFLYYWLSGINSIVPYFDSLAEEYSGVFRFAKLDLDTNQTIAKKLEIQGLPTFIFFKDGNEVGRVVGMDRIRLKKIIDQILSNT